MPLSAGSNWLILEFLSAWLLRNAMLLQHNAADRAKDAESAIKEAIRLFHITDPEQQKRLAARPGPMTGGPME